MNKAASIPITHAELTRHLEGEVTVSRAQQIDHALHTDPVTAGRMAELRSLLDTLSGPDDRVTHVNLLPELHRRLAQPAPARPPLAQRFHWPRWLTLSALALPAAAAAALLAFPRQATPPAASDLPALDPAFRAKGAALPADPAALAGVQAYVEDATGARPLADTMCAQDGLMFSVANGGAQPFGYLMVFLVDAAHQVNWYYPAYTDPASNPSSFPLPSRRPRAELPDRVTHDRLAPGPATLWGVFSHSPRTVAQVEAAVAQARSSGMAALDLGEDALIQRAPVTVRACP